MQHVPAAMQTSPEGQLVGVQTQVPPEQAGVDPVQALPQVPQVAAAVLSTHAPEQQMPFPPNWLVQALSVAASA